MKRTKGFTLIELLVVIAIITILSTIVLANLSQARSKSRDTARISDISQIQLALAAYLNKYSKYPVGSGISTLQTNLVDSNNFMATLPSDPSNDANHKYGYKSVDGSTYCLSANLENQSTFIDAANTNKNGCETDTDTLSSPDVPSVSGIYVYKVTK